MKTGFKLRATALAVSMAMLSACNSGTDSSSADGTTVGVITGFGSIYVNGVEYETDSASVSIDGVSSIETELGVGDVVVLQGSVNPDGVTGTATAVSSTDEVEGYVLDVSGLLADGTGTLIVMGLTVTVTTDTIFDSNTAAASINDVAVTDIVEVSGFTDGNGNIFATRIETKNAAEDVELKGVVSNLNEAESTFTIGALTIDYSAASEVPYGMANDLYVEVKADTAPTDTASGYVLAATKVEIEEDGDMDIEGDEGEDMEVQGYVTAVTDTSFDFNGQTVLFADLESDDDFDLASLTVGMMITVEGYIDAAGNFVIEEIEEDETGDLEEEGLVTAVTETTVTIETIEIAPVSYTFTITNETRMIDEQDEGVTPIHYFSLSDVTVGNFVEVYYYVDETTGDNVATKLERDDVPVPEVSL